ncbi:MAG: hypothetical protein ACP5O3_00275 [Candidatus Micrarchaeia archaeon]
MQEKKFEHDLEVKKPFLSRECLLVLSDARTKKPLASLNFHNLGVNEETREINVITSGLRAGNFEHAKQLMEDVQEILKAIALKQKMNVLHSHLAVEEEEHELKSLEDQNYVKTQEKIEGDEKISRFNKRIFFNASAKEPLKRHGLAAIRIMLEVGQW